MRDTVIDRAAQGMNLAKTMLSSALEGAIRRYDLALWPHPVSWLVGSRRLSEGPGLRCSQAACWALLLSSLH